MRAVVLVVFYGAVAFFASVIIPWLGTRYEAVWNPILTNQKVSNISFDGSLGYLCWEWSWRKVRPAQQIAFRYYLSTVAGGDIPVQLVKKDLAPVTGAERPMGEAAQGFCTYLPAGTDDENLEVTVRGYAEYWTPHGLWPVRQDLPTVRWPGNEVPNRFEPLSRRLGSIF